MGRQFKRSTMKDDNNVLLKYSALNQKIFIPCRKGGEYILTIQTFLWKVLLKVQEKDGL